MIGPHDQLTIRRIPLSLITLRECQPRYPARVLHYVALMQAHPDAHPGLLIVAVEGERFVLRDGFHRLCAHVITGRREALCVVVRET